MVQPVQLLKRDQLVLVCPMISQHISTAQRHLQLAAQAAKLLSSACLLKQVFEPLLKLLVDGTDVCIFVAYSVSQRLPILSWKRTRFELSPVCRGTPS